MAAETQYTANTGLATINVANSSLTGGTVGTNIFSVITGGSTNGTLIKSVTVKATGSPGQGMIRLFVGIGTTQFLIKEIFVNPIMQSGPDISFESTVHINYTLQPDHILYASTQNGDTFNIIAECLDIAYNSTYVRPEATRYTANTGTASISIGTSSTTGSGSTLLVTSSKSGLLLDSFKIKATAATSANGMIRFFIYNGTSYFLFKEVFVPYFSQSGIYKSFEYSLDFPEGFQLKSGYSIYVSTQNSDSFHVTANTMIWNNPSSTIAQVNYTSSNVTGITTEKLLQSYQLSAANLATGNLFRVYGQFTVNNNANTKTFRIYINTSNSLSGATLIGTHIATTVSGDNIERMFPVINNTSIECYGGSATDTRNSYGTTTGTSTAITIPTLTSVTWVIISGQNSSTTDTTTLVWSEIERII